MRTSVCSEAARSLARLCPAAIRIRLSNWLHWRQVRLEHDLGVYVLSVARSFCEHIGGNAESFARVRNGAQRQAGSKGLRTANALFQDAIESFMPSYERHLFEYYQAQQWQILTIMLGYPFLGITTALAAYEQGLAFVGAGMRVLDYGAGIPYGLVNLLRRNPGKVTAAALVDLDLVYAHFAEFLVRHAAPDIELEAIKLRDSEEAPKLQSRYNFIYANNVFEHLPDPGAALANLLAHADPRCMCCLDLRDHGGKEHQHVNPKLTHLLPMVTESGFQETKSIGVLRVFVRT